MKTQSALVSLHFISSEKYLSVNISGSTFDPDGEEMEEDEECETLKTLFREANGNFSVINDYIERCENLFFSDGTLKEPADRVAGEMGIDF